MRAIIEIILFFVFLLMVILGQRNIGYTGLTIQIIGLTGLLTLLFLYNKRNK